MNIFKKTALSVVVFVVVAIVIAYFLPPYWYTQQEIWIDRPPAAVFPHITDLKQWHEWAVWYQEKDPSNTYQFEGPATGVGARTYWEGPKIGKGNLVITRADTQSGIDYELFFPDNNVKSKGTIALKHEVGRTLVTWSESGQLGTNPVMRYFGLFMESMLGNDFEQSLINLKALVEKSEPNANP